MNNKARVIGAVLAVVLVALPLACKAKPQSQEKTSTSGVQIAADGKNEPKAGEERTFAGIKFCWCPAGSFTMGSPDSEAGHCASEGPQHAVTFRQGFWMGKYEVTQGQWKSLMGNYPSRFKGGWFSRTPNLPVERVSWNDCQDFLRKLNAKGDGTFRLPSEAEWEYVCRAGTQTPFSFGETISTDQVNYNGTFTYGSGCKGVFRDKSTDVGSFPANAWNLCDMHGNVYEWCQDSNHDNYNGAPTDGSAWESSADTPHILRGGSWGHDPSSCRAAMQHRFKPDDRNEYLGFRVVCVPLSR